MEVRLTVIGSSPAWPNPGSAQSGYLLGGERPSCCWTAGRACSDASARPGARSTRSRSPTSTSITGATSSPGPGWLPTAPPPAPAARALASARRQRRARELRLASGAIPDMFENAFELHEFEPRRRSTRPGFEVEAQAGAPLHAARLRLSRVRKREGDGVLGRLGTVAELADLAREADLFLCEATLANAGPRRPAPRAPHG